MSVESLTLLICTHNGRNKLEGTLQSIAELKVPKGLSVELLIVDNNSNDGTDKIALDYWNSLGNPYKLEVIKEYKQGKAHALCRGYDYARGDLIILCDDDNWLDKEYLNQVLNLFNTKSDIGLAGGVGRQAVFTNKIEPAWFDKFKWRYMVETHHKRNGYLVKNDYSIYGAGSVLKKSVWSVLSKAGFKFQNYTKKAIAEDLELSMAVAFSGNKLYFNDQLTFVHDLRWGRLSIENLKQQEKLNGKCGIYPIVYELIYHRIGSNFLFFRFLKHYLITVFEVKQQLQKLKTKKLQKDNIIAEVDFVRVSSTYKNMVLMLPIVIFKYPTIKRWIQRLVEHSKAL